MRVVAIRAAHEPFVYTMLEGHRELRSNAGVTAVAKVSLVIGEEEFRDRRFVDGVASGADYIVQRVGGALYIGP
jgi:hypothetical protein